MKNSREIWTKFVPVTCVLLLYALTSPAGKVMDDAAGIVRSSGRGGGIIAMIGGDGALAAALTKQGEFTVHCIQTDQDARSRMCQDISREGSYGSVPVMVSDLKRLPYAANLLSIVVVPGWRETEQAGLSVGELARVLAPLGHLFLGTPDFDTTEELKTAGIEDIETLNAGSRWMGFRKPFPAEIDEWTHYLHGPDGNPVVEDRVVGPPRHYQWIAGPEWLRSHETVSSITTLVTSAGRLFYIEDQGPISLAGQHKLPDNWCLVARDAFNGKFLWKVPIRRWGWREWKSTWFSPRPGGIPLNIQKKLVADGDRIFVTLGYHAPVSMLDARTGNILHTYKDTDPTLEILYLDGRLILSVLESDEKIKVVAVEASSGKKLWETAKTYGGTEVDYYRWWAMRGRIKPADIDPTLNTATDGEVVALIHGDSLVALDFETGRQLWKTKFPLEEADLNAGRIKTEGNLWTGTMIVSDGVVLHASPYKLAGFSSKTGEILWERPKAYIGHLWSEWKDVFVNDDLVWTWEGELENSRLERGKGGSRYPRKVIGYDLKTGAIKREIDLGYVFKTHHHHRCYRNKATSRYILASRRGTEYIDLEKGRHTLHNWVRGTCHLGMVPANGLQYAPPHPCRCYSEEKIKNLNALAPLRPDELPGSGVPAAERTRQGAAPGKTSGPGAGENDWPTFRSDNQRTGSVDTEIPVELSPLWTVRTAVGDISPPVAVGDNVYLADINGFRVICLNASDGSQIWSYTAQARIDSPPTYHDGTVIFGSADGRVYCLDAAAGKIVWIFDAAPLPRLIAVEGRVESAWPVHGSVLVQEQTAYFACGRSSQLDGGIRMYALDAATGRVKVERVLAGPDYRVGADGRIEVWKDKTSSDMLPAENDFGENYRLPTGLLSDVFASDGNLIYMRSRAFDKQLKPCPGKPAMLPTGGFLDGTYFKRMPWQYLGNYSRMLVKNDDTAAYVRMFDSLRGLDPSVYFTPGKQGYLLFAVKENRQKDGKKQEIWSSRVRVRVRTMILAAGRLIAAGPPDLMDLDAFAGKAGGRLQLFDVASGKKLSEHELRSPPVFNGAAAARSRLFVSCEDGSVACFGKDR